MNDTMWSTLPYHDGRDVPKQDNNDVSRGYRDETIGLFDFSTVRGKEVRSVVTSTVVTKTKVALVAGKITLVEERFISYSEAPCERSRSLASTFQPLLLVKGCGNRAFDGQASMPCLRIDQLDLNGYNEPIRDRDKDWRLDSQRGILDEAGVNISLPPLGMGKYENNKKLKTTIASEVTEERIGKRKKHLFQFSMLISESHCIVDVLGSGIEGRVFVEGRNTGRSIVVQIYSFWNCSKYSLTLTAAQLVRLFTDVQRRDLMKPGKKEELIKAIVERCYFTYKITIPPPVNKRDQAPTVVRVDHLTLPSIPFGYPQNVEEIIRELNLPPGNREYFSCPTLEQELKVGTEIRENFRLAKERELPEKLRKLEEERVRLQAIWDNTPKRKRGYVYSQVRRLDGRMIVFSGCRFPAKRPGVAAVSGFVCGLAESLPITIVFSDMAVLFKIKGRIENWPQSAFRLALKHAINDMTLLLQQSIPGMILMTSQEQKKILSEGEKLLEVENVPETKNVPHENNVEEGIEGKEGETKQERKKREKKEKKDRKGKKDEEHEENLTAAVEAKNVRQHGDVINGENIPVGDDDDKGKGEEEEGEEGGSEELDKAVVKRIYIENYLKMKSFQRGRGASVVMSPVDWYSQKTYYGGERMMNRRDTCVRHEYNSSLGRLYNDFGMRGNPFKDEDDDWCANDYSNRLIVSRAICLSAMSVRATTGQPIIYTSIESEEEEERNMILDAIKRSKSENSEDANSQDNVQLLPSVLTNKSPSTLKLLPFSSSKMNIMTSSRSDILSSNNVVSPKSNLLSSNKNLLSSQSERISHSILSSPSEDNRRVQFEIDGINLPSLSPTNSTKNQGKDTDNGHNTEDNKYTEDEEDFSDPITDPTVNSIKPFAPQIPKVLTSPSGVLILKSLPRRMDLNRGVRVASRGLKKDGVYCVYTVYIDNPAMGENEVYWDELMEVKQIKQQSRASSVSHDLSFDTREGGGGSEGGGGGGKREGSARRRGSGMSNRSGGSNMSGRSRGSVGGTGGEGGVELKGNIYESVDEDDNENEEEDKEKEDEDENDSEEDSDDSDNSKDGSEGSGDDDDDDDDEDSDEDFAHKLFGSRTLSSNSGRLSSRKGGKGKGRGEEDETTNDEKEIIFLNKMFDLMINDLSITFDFYFPFNNSFGELGEYQISECSTISLTLKKEDLYRTVVEHKHVLHLALRAGYIGFYNSAVIEESTAAEGAWDSVATEVVSKLIWDLSSCSAINPGGTGIYGNGGSGGKGGRGGKKNAPLIDPFENIHEKDNNVKKHPIKSIPIPYTSEDQVNELNRIMNSEKNSEINGKMKDENNENMKMVKMNGRLNIAETIEMSREEFEISENIENKKLESESGAERGSSDAENEEKEDKERKLQTTTPYEYKMQEIKDIKEMKEIKDMRAVEIDVKVENMMKKDEVTEESLFLSNIRKMHDLTSIRSVPLITPFRRNEDNRLKIKNKNNFNGNDKHFTGSNDSNNNCNKNNSNDSNTGNNNNNNNDNINNSSDKHPLSPGLALSTVLFSCAMRVKPRQAPKVHFNMTASDADDEGEDGGGTESWKVRGVNGEGDKERNDSDGSNDSGVKQSEGNGEIVKEVVNEEEEDEEDIPIPLFEINIEEYVTETPLLHLTFYQKGDVTGVIGYNPNNREISFLQEKDKELQAAFNQSIRFLSTLERSLLIKLYLQSVRYSKVMNSKTRIFHDSISFVNPNDEPDEMGEAPEFDLNAAMDIQKESTFKSFAKESLSKKEVYHKQNK